MAYLVYLLERALRVACVFFVSAAPCDSHGDPRSDKNHREKVVLLVDFKDHSQLTGVSQLAVAKEVLSILQNQYPGSDFSPLFYACLSLTAIAQSVLVLASW